MEQKTTTKETILKSSQELRNRCRYNFKIHFNCSEIWSYVNTFLGIMNLIFGGGAGVAVAKQNQKTSTFACIGGVLFSGGLLTALNPSERSQRHKNAGHDYSDLERELRLFEMKLDIPNDNNNIQSQLEYLEKLNTKKSKIDREAPIASEVVKWYVAKQLKPGGVKKPLDD
mmetsp:Transcript_29261/g.41191  ORF Transcript_29261/g.41191 Transcript_29261/m.41191 type:complete len:171 (-) Transcript_29261:682-1194(-)